MSLLEKRMLSNGEDVLYLHTKVESGMNILLIETSSKTCSVALYSDGKIVYSKRNEEGMMHAKVLSVYISEALGENKDVRLDGVAVSAGPGSYTGLRIGVSTAKGIAFGYGIPLIAVPTLDLIAETAKKCIGICDGKILSMVDARRMEVYSQMYTSDLEKVGETKAEVINEDSYKDIICSGENLYIAGDGACKCKSVLSQENVILVENVNPIAENMAEIAMRRLKNNETEDVAYFEPEYVKDFVATQPKHRII